MIEKTSHSIEPLEVNMTKFHVIIVILGLPLFLLDMTYGIGWLVGWIFVGLLRQYRGVILERIIDFNDFSSIRYIMYLLLVMVWIALPLGLSVLLPQYINPIAVFGAFFADRVLMFVIESVSKKEVS